MDSVVLWGGLAALVLLGYGTRQSWIDYQKSSRSMSEAEGRSPSTAPPIVLRPGDNNLPRGLRNNNPLNIKGESYGWKGMVGVDEYGHIIFSAVKYGYRAAARDMRNKWRRWNRANIRKLTCTWAEANCDKYADFVGQQANVNPDRLLDRHEFESIMPDVIRAMAIWENGIAYSNLIHMQDIRDGVRLA